MNPSEASNKRQKSAKDVPYKLVYWPGAPGRAEHIRLAFEESGASYTDTALTSEDPMKAVLAFNDPDGANALGDDLNPPVLTPPILQHGDLTIHQMPNILMYLAPRLGLAPSSSNKDESETSSDPDGIYRINALVLTALDGLSDAPHDCHHPIGAELYYEDQKNESLRKSKHYVTYRLPKFLGYFERVLRGKASGEGPWLYGGQVTTADLVLFQCFDGVKFMFPKAVLALDKSGDYKHVFEHYEAVKQRPRIKAYLESDRRQKYTLGIYRYYSELDVLADEKK